MKTDALIVNGVRIDGQSAAPDAGRELTLPSGRIAKITRPTGRHLMRAHRVAPPNESVGLFYALLAEVVEIDGKRVVYEDLLDADLPDVFALLREVFGENFPAAADAVTTGSLPPLASPGSSTSESQSKS